MSYMVYVLSYRYKLYLIVIPRHYLCDEFVKLGVVALLFVVQSKQLVQCLRIFGFSYGVKQVFYGRGVTTISSGQNKISSVKK